jgi:histidinol phosphatase-like enzyme
MIIYVDIDGTICKTKDSDYKNARPRRKKIRKINALAMAGHTIIFWTARGSSSGKNWKKLTYKQLVRWGVIFDELRFKKPSYDIWFDDKARKL